MKKTNEKSQFVECTDGEFRKHIRVSVFLTKAEIEEYSKCAKQSYHGTLREALTAALSDKLLALWEDFGEEPK